MSNQEMPPVLKRAHQCFDASSDNGLVPWPSQRHAFCAGFMEASAAARPATFTQVYVYEGKRYEVLGMGKMKCPTTRQWIPAVIYRDEGTPGFDSTHVRDMHEFHARFKLLGPKHLPGGA